MTTKKYSLVLTECISCAEVDFVFFSEFYRDFERFVEPINLHDSPNQLSAIIECLRMVVSDNRLKLFNDYFLNGDPDIGFIEYRGKTESKVDFIMSRWRNMAFVRPQIYDVCMFGFHTVEADHVINLD
jgi:hypothetical protein